MTQLAKPALSAIAAVALLAACSTSSDPAVVAGSADVHAVHARGTGELTAAQHQAVAQVRNVTARFHDIKVARDAGYTNQYPAGCAVSPDGAGAQAFHYLDPSRVDATIELLRPELVMYEPQKNGKMELIGVDYVVPFDQWTASEPPSLLGVPFMRNEPLGVWALHIWAWRPNPSGMFAAWNPKVSCEHAGAVTP